MTIDREARTLIVVYDGACGVCEAVRGWVEKRVADGFELQFVANQDPDLAKVAPRVDREQAEKAILLLDGEGKLFQGAAAVAEILVCLRDPWPLFGHLLRLKPVLSIAEPCYRLVARHRRRISGWLGLTRCPYPG